MEVMMKPSERQWLEDYHDFLNTEEVPVPPELSHRVLTLIKRRMLPSVSQIFIKLLILHIPIGILSLFVCDQFGMSPFDSNISLYHYFMYFGHSVCMFLCGSFFIGGSILISSFILKPHEVRALRNKSYIQSFLLAGISYGGFLLFGAEITLSIALVWILGAILGGILSSEVVFRFRLYS
jgi:hypothetical protein